MVWSMKPLVTEISRLSSLTSTQFETLGIHESLRKNEISMDFALTVRKSAGISKGTHYRILAQGKKNMRESLFTLVTAVQLGLVRPDDVERLLSTAARIPADIDEARIPEIVTLLRVLVDRIVM